MNCNTNVKLSPQAREVLRALERLGSLTPVEASAILKVRSLTARIAEINCKTSANITREWKMDLEGQRYMRYSLQPAELSHLKRTQPHLFD